MHSWKSTHVWRRLLLLLSLALSACSSAPTASPTPAATTTPAPSPTQAASATPAPSPTPALPTFTPVPTPVPGGLFVDPAMSRGPISPLVYGTNTGPWTGVGLETGDDIAVAGLKLLRFPGGEHGDSFNLTGKEIDDFIKFCRDLGAEPSISVRLPGGSPELAAAMVKYANVEHDYNVRYWAIGNEPSLYDNYDTVQFNKDWRAFAQAMRAVDPTIKLIGPDIHQFTPDGGPKDPAGRFWMREFLLANGADVDLVGMHRYPFPRQMAGEIPTVEDLRQNTREWDEIVPALRALIRETTGKDLPIAVTEVNSNWSSAAGSEGTPDSHFGAIWWADALGRMITHDVEMVAHFAIRGPSQQGWGLVGNFDPRPAYYVYPMYKMFGEELVYSSSDDPYVSIYGARRKDGALTAMVINLKSEAVTIPLRLAGAAPSGQVEVWRFDKEHKATQIDPLPAGAELQLELSPESLTLLVIRD